MHKIKRLSKSLVYSLICVFTLTCLTSTAVSADIISTELLIEQQRTLETQTKINSLLSRQDVQAKLVHYGISPSEASQRVAALTLEEAEQLAQDIENLPAGGDVVLLLVVIILVLLLR